MELPIAPESYRPSNAALSRALQRAALALGRVAGDEIAVTGASGVVNADRPSVRCCNFAAELQPSAAEPAAAGALLDELEQAFKDAGARCLTVQCADDAAPSTPALAQALTERGWRPAARGLYLLTKYQPPARRNEQLQIIPARAAYKEMRALFAAQATLEFAGDAAFAQAFSAAMIDRLDEPRLELMLGRMKGEPVITAGVMTLGEIGVIIPAWCHPDHRGGGVAGTLMSEVLDHCIRAQFKQVILDRSEGCPAIPFYQRLGFTRVAGFTRYHAPTPAR